jgi:hypothetical protein
LKTNADKAINYIQLYRMDHEVGYLFDAKRLIDRELTERKKTLQSANPQRPRSK